MAARVVFRYRAQCRSLPALARTSSLVRACEHPIFCQMVFHPRASGQPGWSSGRPGLFRSHRDLKETAYEAARALKKCRPAFRWYPRSRDRSVSGDAGRWPDAVIVKPKRRKLLLHILIARAVAGWAAVFFGEW